MTYEWEVTGSHSIPAKRFSFFFFLQGVQITFCTSERVVQLVIAGLVYSATLLIILFVLTFLTLRTTVSLSAFHREGRLSYVALAIILTPVPIFTVLLAIASTEEMFEDDVIHILLLWVEFALGVLLPMLIMMTLFLPNVSIKNIISFQSCFKSSYMSKLGYLIIIILCTTIVSLANLKMHTGTFILKFTILYACHNLYYLLLVLSVSVYSF